MAPGSGANNNNKPAGRGRPVGRPKGQSKIRKSSIASNYTLADLQEKKKRAMKQGNPQDTSSTASPAKKRLIASGNDRTSSPSTTDPQIRSPSAIPVLTSLAGIQTRRTRASSLLQKEFTDASHQVDTCRSDSSLGGEGSGSQESTQEVPTPLQQLAPDPIPASALSQLLDRFNAVESKLEKLDSMEKQLNKLDVIETKTSNIDLEIHNIQKSVETIYSEIDTLKSKVHEDQNTMRKEFEDFKVQQDEKLAEAVSIIRQEVTQETQKHFNAFTKHLESAFVKEQASQRKSNLIFTGVQESLEQSVTNIITDICYTYLGLPKISIYEAHRLGELKENNNNPRPILVKFNSMEDRTRVWRAKKHLQRSPGGRIWIQEDTPRCLKEDLRILIRVAKHAESLQKEEYKGTRVKDFQLIFQGRRYSVADLEGLPPELRPSSLCLRGSDESIAFFGKYTPLSNHHRSPFRINGVLYNTVEQYLAVARASLLGKKDLKESALSLPDPIDSKKILNSLKNDHAKEWEDQRATVLMEALRNKFNQNNLLANYLKETYPLHLG